MLSLEYLPIVHVESVVCCTRVVVLQDQLLFTVGVELHFFLSEVMLNVCLVLLLATIVPRALLDPILKMPHS